jgi:DNA-directed RNA polymerase subunit H
LSEEGLPSKMILEHELVPKHEILEKTAVESILKGYGIKITQLPKIKAEDPAVKSIKAKKGDVIRIRRHSLTAREAVYYRLVI